MILAVDAGNTNIVLGCIEAGKLTSVARMETNRKKTDYEYAVTIHQILRLGSPGTVEFEGAIISSVVPPLTEALHRAVRMVTGCDALVVGAGLRTGLNIGLDDPATMGADLVAAAVAAIALYPAPQVIIDMGTATTMTVIARNARVLGGAILAGVGLATDALVAGASLLPRIPIDPPDRCIGSNTVDAMKSGAVFGAAEAIDGMIGRIEAELGESVTAVATGGLASRIVPYCRHPITLNDDLLLQGLWLLWDKNARRRAPAQK